MATYNGERFIAEAIQSILDQTYTRFEFLIIDDGSTDRTAEIIEQFDDDRIIYIKKPSNTGIAESLNLGIKHAKGHYIARMDDDDISFPHRFEKQLHVMESKPDLIFCGTNVQDHLGVANFTPEHHDDILLTLLFFKNPIFHPTVLIKKEVLLQHPYNPKRVPAEDHDLWSRLIFKGQFYQLQEPLFYVRLHTTSITATRRHEQLIHNISISKYIYETLGFEPLDHHDEHIKIMASHDYSISGLQLKGLIIWLEALKQLNATKGTFQVSKFNAAADKEFQRFLTSYFKNNPIKVKAKAFLNLSFKYKIFIIIYYVKKYYNLYKK